DWGPGTLTHSGYPFILKRLPRGAQLADAEELFRGRADDVNVQPAILRDPDGRLRGIAVFRALTFFESEAWLLGDGAPIRLPVPLKSQFRDFVAGQLVFSLDEEWRHGSGVYPAGALISLDLEACRADAAQVKPRLIH